MSYQAQDQLTYDPVFQGRVRSCAVQQAHIYKDDARPDFVALANNVMRGNPDAMNAFITLSAAGPGIADKADNGDGTIDQSKITDEDFLALIQANWQTVAGLYFNEDGTSIEG